jgi:cadmium resistance protein CadD (predicted permease)
LILLGGLAMFAATNVDGLLLTAALLSDRSFRARDVIAGTYGGIGALYAVSAAGSLIRSSCLCGSSHCSDWYRLPSQLKNATWRKPVRCAMAGYLAWPGSTSPWVQTVVNHPSVGAPVRRYGPRLVPYVLIALGVWILSGF